MKSCHPECAEPHTHRYRCYADLAHRPHRWDVIGEPWWCDGYLFDAAAWRSRLRHMHRLVKGSSS